MLLASGTKTLGRSITEHALFGTFHIDPNHRYNFAIAYAYKKV